MALRGDTELDVVGDVGSAAEALDIARTTSIDVAVVDILMPNTSGITLATQLREVQPSCRVLALSVIDEPGVIADTLRANACGFASKTQCIEEIIDAIHQVLSGLRYLPPLVSRDAVDAELLAPPSNPLHRLSRREREVFELLIRGYSNDEVATKLFISRRTAETHRQRILAKTSAHTIVQLQRLSARYGGHTS